MNPVLLYAIRIPVFKTLQFIEYWVFGEFFSKCTVVYRKWRQIVLVWQLTSFCTTMTCWICNVAFQNCFLKNFWPDCRLVLLNKKNNKNFLSLSKNYFEPELQSPHWKNGLQVVELSAWHMYKCCTRIVVDIQVTDWCK